MPHFMIVESPYYKEISDHLMSGALTVLDAHKISCEVFQVPGALEITPAIHYGSLRKESRGTETRKFDGYIALGCIIRGETSHYEIVCNESARGLSKLALKYKLPLGNGILTCDTMEQALVRADPAQKNKGADAANAALELFKIKRSFRII